MSNKRKGFWKRFDFTLFFTVILLGIYGLIVLSSATAGEGSMSYLKTQGIAFVLGLIAIAILVFIGYETFGKFYMVIYVFSNLLLIAVLFLGVEDKGAQSWIKLGSFSFQPSEFVKIGVIISVAKFIEKNHEKINQIFTLLKVLIFAFIPVGLILLQPDFGTAIVFVFFIFVMLFVAGIDWKYILYAAIAGIVSLPILWFSFDIYQKNRIFDFLDPSRDALGSGYQVIQSKIAIGSGQIFGMGLYNGNYTQFGFLPEKHTDFIFSVIGEELGLIGGLALIILYFIMMYRLIKIAKNSKDIYGSVMVVGIAAMMMFHILENIGMTMGLMPVTGIPLPFISNGGTFLLSNMICIGLVLSVGMKREGLSFSRDA
ncbi:rod shape-determining protein RodA [Proteiniborus sp. MB09-C3]|uniref:rod shape-determining protein RodA n=1 Tax=Proteiniborus sp. MB09-C3 TaxID=3050072 RepID=UPI002557751A|nr:rod shape-determining protein RodA [Proteiniborus sp. MB09-C3]WIV13861.1 rod shape-determining protein RodA [Proteiniborus sp. MB09-C3]